MFKLFSVFVISSLVFASSARASADEDPFMKCLNSDRHDICYAAMNTYEERLKHARGMSEFCTLGIRYASLQGFDSVIQKNSEERKKATDSIKLLIGKCDEPVKGLGRSMLQKLKPFN